MRITTRVSIGLFLMAGLMIASLTYQLAQVERLQQINREVALTNLEGARISLRLLEAIGGVHEFSAKYQILPDSAYRTQWSEWENAASEELDRLAAVGLSRSADDVRQRIEEGWDRYIGLAGSVRPTATGSPLPVEGLADLQRVLADLRANVGELIAANDAAVAEQASSSAYASERARSIAWLSALSALLVAGILSFLLYRWISDPLRRLTRATKEIARGRFDHGLRIQGPTELSDLERDFDRMAKRLDELDNLKRDFVSHVSHELKSPLAAIQETIELLLEELPGSLNEKQMRLLELSRSSSTRLAAMITDLLEVSRLEAGAAGFIPASNDIAELAASTIEEVDLLAAEREIEIELSTEAQDSVVVCDRNRVREVITNLISNGLRFSPEHGRLSVTVSEAHVLPATCPTTWESVQREPGPFLLLSVEDDGPGVPDSEKERIFEKFHQVRDGTGLGGPGVGLGLAISSHIVEMHAGAIWVEDRVPRGAAFRVLLPRVPSQWIREIQPRPTSGPVHSLGEPEVVSTARGPAAGAAVALTVASIVAGCGGGAPAGSTPSPDPLQAAAVVDVPEEEAPAVPDFVPPPFERHAPEVILDNAWLFLSAGDFEGARDRFERVTDEAGGSRFAAEALWGLAMLHLLPESPFFDSEEAEIRLDYLREEFPYEGVGVQAAWMRRLLADLAEVQVTVVSQEEALRRLAETVERLKDIDLNRTPQRVAPTPEP